MRIGRCAKEDPPCDEPSSGGLSSARVEGTSLPKGTATAKPHGGELKGAMGMSRGVAVPGVQSRDHSKPCRWARSANHDKGNPSYVQ
jgi:hypothetical protein